MCEKTIRKLKKASHVTRLREARRIQRLQQTAAQPTRDAPHTGPPGPPKIVGVDKALQNRVIIELAWKTVALMQKNKIIQQKINELQKETSEFVKSVMNNPDNQKRYAEHMRLMALQKQQQMPVQTPIDNNNIPIKVEPEA